MSCDSMGASHQCMRSCEERGTQKPGVSRICRICGTAGTGDLFMAREMLLGTREEFGYFECTRCGCLQIADIPQNLGQYYPDGYYSLCVPGEGTEDGVLRTLFRKRRDAYLLYREGFGGNILQALRPAELPFGLLGRVHGIRSRSILDVGCGSGLFLKRLKELGLNNVMGVDPFIRGDLYYADGLKVLKRTIQELSLEAGRGYDVILFNHSFEHMPDPNAVLQAAARLVNDGGRVIIHIPLAGSHAWKRYGKDWVQLDAPRHLYLFSPASLQILSDRAGFVIDDVVYTSNAFQFWGSELYARDIPLSMCGTPGAGFSRREMRRFKAEARALNERKVGDQAAFYLRKS